MGDDLFKSGSPVVVLKDKARPSERRDFYCQCFLANMLSDPQALNVVFEGGRGRENAKLNGTHTTVSPFATAKVNNATSEASEHQRTLLLILILPLKVGNGLGGQSYKNVGPCRETIL